MYKNKETEISYKYLSEVILHLNEPICIIGGWAVYFIVNKNFEKERKYPYLGSRDIDLGFNNTHTAVKAIEKLEEIGFKKLSFRMYKEVHSDSMKELDTEEAKRTPLHCIFPMYVDIIMNKSNKDVVSELGFAPVDELLLSPIFSGNEKIELKKFGRTVIIPSPVILLAMKIKSIKDRDKEHKKVKDLCDIIALLLYSGEEKIYQKLKNIVSPEEIDSCIDSISKEDIKKAAQIILIDETLIENILDKLK